MANTNSILSSGNSSILNFNQSTNLEGSEIFTVEPNIPEPSLLESITRYREFKKHNAPGLHHIPSELIQAGGDKLYEEIHKLIVLIWNKEELPQEWKESIIIPIHKKGDRMDCNNYRGISLLSTSYKILSNIFYRE